MVYGDLKGVSRLRAFSPGLAQNQGAAEQTNATAGSTARWAAPEIFKAPAVDFQLAASTLRLFHYVRPPFVYYGDVSHNDVGGAPSKFTACSPCFHT